VNTPLLPPTSSSIDHAFVGSISLIATGVIMVGVGSWFGLNSLDTAEKARSSTNGQEYDQFKLDAQDQALYADISMGLGALLLGSGVYWFISNQKKSSNSTSSGTVQLKASQSAWHLGYQVSF
jgi:hypothetical protein